MQKKPQKIERRRDNTAATRSALIKTGRRLFGSNGYEKTSIEQICSEAGVTNGSLYHHFGDKAGLYAEIIATLDIEVTQVLKGALARAASVGADPWDALIAVFEGAIELGGLDSSRRKFYFGEAVAVLGRKRWLDLHEKNVLGTFVEIVQGLQQAGILLPGDPRMIARMIEGIVFAAVETLPEEADKARVMLPSAKGLARTVLQSLRART